MIIVSDTSPISNLIIVGKLRLLEDLFREIIIPPSVDIEIKRLINFNVDIAEYIDCTWIKVVQPFSVEKVKDLELKLDKGEAEAIVLAEDLKCDILLIDERRGSRIAKARGLDTVGLLGVLLKAKELHLINKVKPLLEDLQIIAGFWIGEELKEQFLKDANE